MKLLCWLILLISVNANARVFSETFNTTTQQASSTLVWNFELGYLHPQLQIYNYRNASQATASQTTFSVSDGSHGAFEPGTYELFGTVSGSHITIDANQFPILKLTRFHLNSSHTLSSINGPLVIHSLSTVIIDGIIECFGENGSSAVGATGGAGGLGRCGGFTGGNGGNAATSGTRGLPLIGNITGGGAGVYNGVAPGAGGGGGAAYVGNDGNVGLNSNPPTNIRGAAGSGTATSDHGFDNLNGSAGGGGGSGSNTEGGAGGGGGGGTVVIHAVGNVIISATGLIQAFGGNGGAANTGGGGGGGGGGNVKIFTPVALNMTPVTPIDVNAGQGSIPVLANAGDGGDGSFGRTWDVAGSFPGPGLETHGPTLLDVGTVGYVSGTVQVASSKSYDTESTLVTYESITASPASSDISFEIAGSDDNFASDDTGWINAAAISVVAKKRYVKYRISVNNSNDANPTIVDDVYINFDPGTKENFAFKSSGCGLVKNTPPQNMHWLLFLLLFIPLLLAWRLRKPKTVRVPVKK